jgi:hypothetical protein
VDVRLRIETRTTEWSLLTSKDFSWEGKRAAQDAESTLLLNHPFSS